MFTRSRMFGVILTAVLGVASVAGKNFYTINAAIVGLEGNTQIRLYRAALRALNSSEDGYCRISLFPVEYDTKNGSTVYRSLVEARETFNNELTTVAIGPSISVFTSMDYVILNQIHLVTSSGPTMEESPWVLPVLPDARSLSAAVAEVVKSLGWKKVAFLSQDDFSPVLALSDEKILAWPIQLPGNISSATDPEVKQTMTRLREAQMEHFVLHSMNEHVIQTIIQAAEAIHLLHHSRSWLITYLDFASLKLNLTEKVNLYGLQLLDDDYIPPSLFRDPELKTVSRLNIGLVVDVIGQLKHVLKERRDWPCNIEPRDNKTLPAGALKLIMQSGNRPYIGALGKYEWVQTKRQGNGISRRRINYSISVKRFHINKDSNSSSEKIGNCSFDGNRPEYIPVGFTGNPASESDITKTIRGMHFNVITKEDAPFVFRTGDRYSGFCIDVLNHLENLMGFKYNIIEHNSREGDEDSEWDDILHRLIVGEASMAVGALVVKAKREAKISFSYTLLSTSVSMLQKLPPQKPTFFQFLWPFSRGLWFAIIGFIVILAISLFMMTKFDTTQKDAEQKFDIQESLWYSLNVILQGGTDFSPQTTSMRTIVAFFWFCTLVITAAYTANLAAFLTLKNVDHRIKTLNRLAAQTTVAYGVLNNSDLMVFFRDATEDPYERMWTWMKVQEHSTLMKSRLDGVMRVLNSEEHSKFAYLDDGLFNDYFAKKYCNMESTEQSFGSKHYSIGFPKGAPYKDDINRALLRLKEEGVLDKLKEKWWKTGDNCTVHSSDLPSQRKSGGLELEDMVGVFIVLGVCLVLAIFIEIGTRIYDTVQDKKKRKSGKDGPLNEPVMRRVSLEDVYWRNSTDDPVK